MTGEWRKRGMLDWRIVAVLCAALMSSACVFSIGDSAEGRPLAVQTFGSGARIVLLIGGLHTGNEDNSRAIAEQIAAYVGAHPEFVPAGVMLIVVPAANPDGTAHGWHTNARGVDLNRNWPADDWSADACHPSTGCRRGLGGPEPLSEPETSALYHFIAATRPEITVVWHAEAPLVEANEVDGADVYGRAFADAAGYPYVEEWIAYPITGQLIDALEQRLGLRAFDVELAQCCTITDDEFERNLHGLRALLAAAAGGGAGSSRATRTPTRAPIRQKTPTPQPGINLPFLPTVTPRPD